MNCIRIYTACADRIRRLGFDILLFVHEFSVIFWWVIGLLRHVPFFKRASDSESCADQKEGQDLNGYVPDWLHSETYDDDDGDEKLGEKPIQIQKNTVRYRELITEFHESNEFVTQVHECDVGSVEEGDSGIEESLNGYCERFQDTSVMAEASESLNRCCETVQNTLVMTETVEAEDGEIEKEEDPDEDTLVVDNGCMDASDDLVDICSETVQHLSDNGEQSELQSTAKEEGHVGLVLNENVSSVDDIVAGLDTCDDMSKEPLDNCSAANENASGMEEKEESGRIEDQGHEASGDGFSSVEDYEDEEDHDFFLEKLRSDIRRLRGGNLSVIPEESESDLAESSAWESESGTSMSDSFSSFRKTELEEDSIETFYEKYTERMRCFDKLNHQQTYALGVFQSHETVKPKSQGVASRLKKYILNKPEVTDSSQESMKRLQQDLETVYVGQTCLSWEALHWQYRKFREMALRGSEQDLFYDRVADQFQQFQVLLQRFLENEQFEGPRILNYARSRCIWTSLLQVPCFKGSMKEAETEAGTEVDATITAAQLVSIMEESIMIFWDFVRADKHKCLAQHQMLNFLCVSQEVEDPDDSTLLHSLRRSLHSKKVKVRELQRRGRCLIKRLDPVDRGEGMEILMTLVDIKLISRVLKMSRITTDHLQWCQKKIGKLSVREGKVHRAHSTVLFP